MWQFLCRQKSAERQIPHKFKKCASYFLTYTLYFTSSYGQSSQLRYIRGLFVLPIAYVQTKPPKHRARNWCIYAPEGRAAVHKSLEKVNVNILHYLMENPVQGKSIEYNDNRLALYCAQQGKCAITGQPLVIGDIHYHHKTRRADGGDDKYSNLVLIKQYVHILLHAVHAETISYYLQKFSLNSRKNDKLNRLRKRLNLTLSNHKDFVVLKKI